MAGNRTALIGGVIKMIPIQTYIFKRKIKNGIRSFRVRWKDPQSGRWRSTSGGRSEDEAKIIEAQVRQDILRGLDPTASPSSTLDEWTVTQIIDRFYDHSRYLSGTEKWKRDIKQKIDNDILPQLGALKFKELGSEKIFQFYLKLKERSLTHSTLEKYHNLLRILGDIYAEYSPDTINPLRKIRDFSKRFPKQAPSRDINFLAPEELKLLFTETARSTSKLFHYFCKFLSYSGLRREEAYDLESKDVDPVSGFIHVRDSKTGRSRIVPLEAEAWDAIKDLIANDYKYIFTYPNGKRPHIDSFLRPLQRAAKRAKIHKRIDLHTLRHSYGSNKIRMGWGLKKVSVLLGHADITTTAKIYTHLLDGDLKVRDDTRLDFDNDKDWQHSERKGEEHKVVQMIAKTITNTLGDTSNVYALTDFLRSLSNVSSLVQQRVSATSAEKSPDFHEDSKNSSHAPLMLHHSPEAAASSKETSNTANGLSVSLQELVALQKGMPTCGIEPQTYALRKRCSTN